MKDWVLVAVTNVDVARLQFAATSIFHFLFVPITIGMAFLVAILQTRWHRSGDEGMLRATRFFGVLLVINVAVGVVTGLVQEFQFGMNWSSYSRYVGDVFGAPLAMEGLIAFFLESTFLGVWLFGWNRLPKRVHLFSIWAVAAGTVLSAAFIIAANSWMQHPVGYHVVNGRAELTSVWAVLGSSFFLLAFVHVILGAVVTAAFLMLGVSAWQLKHKQETGIFRRTARIGLIALLPAALLAAIVGSELGVVVTSNQPMKIAASEALWNTQHPASFSLFQIGGFSKDDPDPSFRIAIPNLLSFLATNDPNGKVQGMNQVQAKYEQQYGAGDYYPNVATQYWSMRVMAYLAGLVFLFSLWGLWLLRKNRIDNARVFKAIAIWGCAVVPILMNMAGWILTEMGRQPWIVQGLQLTKNGVSASVSVTSIWISLIVFVLIYGTLAVVDAALMIKFARRDLPPVPAEPDGGGATASVVY